MADELKIKLYSVVLDCKDSEELAKFYVIKCTVAFGETKGARIYGYSTDI